MAGYIPPTGYEPKLFDDLHYSETTKIIFQEESGDKDAVPSYLIDAELDDETIGKALSSPLFIQERGESADRRQAYHSYEESSCHSRTVRPVHELSSLSSRSREKSSREMEKRIKILLERQKEQILADVGTEIQKHEFQADSDRRSIQELNGIVESQSGEFIMLIKETNDFDSINDFVMNNYRSKIGISVKLMRKASMRWKS